MDRSAHQPTNVPNGNNISQRESHGGLKMPPNSTPLDLEKGPMHPPMIERIELNKEKFTPDHQQKTVGEAEKHVLSLQADIISVLSGHSNTRSGMKYRRDQNIKFTNNFPISKSNYDGMSNF